MKKLLTTLVIIVVVLFLFITKINAKKEFYIYRENYHNIKFKNLNSKNINELFDGINATVIEIEVKTQYFTKNYRFHTGITTNIERKLLEEITKDLKDLGKQELATTYQISGIKITRMGILCTYEELEKIKSRTEVE